jgi:hypothetical protein
MGHRSMVGDELRAIRLRQNPSQPRGWEEGHHACGRRLRRQNNEPRPVLSPYTGSFREWRREYRVTSRKE